MWADALAYNAELRPGTAAYTPGETQSRAYSGLLNVDGSGIMGYIEIPKISVSLPIYHGTGEAVLQVGVGHLDWTSLPTGGEGTHTVLSGHRGLPSAKLFTHLDQMEVGDTFQLRILDEVLTYQVDQILIVLPEETSDLVIQKGKDYCTLITCTPYGINTHRLLVRGQRVETTEEVQAVRVTAEAVQVETTIVAPILAIPVLLLVLFGMAVYDTVKKQRKRRENAILHSLSSPTEVNRQ